MMKKKYSTIETTKKKEGFTMKRTLLIALVVIMALGSTSLFAQATDNAQVAAVVQAALSIAKDVDVNFGDISATGTPILDATGGTHTDVGGTATVGEFTITGESGATVNITLTAATTLLGANAGVNTMTYTAAMTEHVSTLASAVAVSNPVTMGGTTHKVFLGGNLGTLTSQATGTYTSDGTGGGGNMVVNVVYN